mmetsp:Transcript_14163/g.25377  ORF Transcript_14163/g.25377 Transcript_14163/m.25377 type:complete len:162 (-) Transcript_14163:1729-2214(-)
MPMGIPGASPMVSSSQEHYPSPKLEGRESSNPSQRPSGTMSPFPLGKMNPDATAFSPSYMAAVQGTGHQIQQTPQGAPQQFTYDFPQAQGVAYPPQSGHYPGFYTTAAGVSPGFSYTASPQHERTGVPTSDSAGKSSQQAASPVGGATSSTASGKENVSKK